MIDILKIMHIASASRQSNLTGGDIEKALAIIEWQKDTLNKARAAGGELQPSVQALSDYLTCDQGDNMARMYATQMLKEAKLEWFVFKSIQEWLICINYVIQRAPDYLPSAAHFPMSKLFVFFMYTPSGANLFRLKKFNDLLTDILKAWCAYLDSEASRSVLNPTEAVPATSGWLSPDAQTALCLAQYANYKNKDNPDMPYWGFVSYNDFFHREIKPELRPINDPEDECAIVSANDGTVYRIARNVEKCAEFWAKGQDYSLVDMLDKSQYTDDFVGGDVMQSFLDGSDYHRWHAPISGKVVEAKVIQGLTFSELLSEGLDLSAGTMSQGYEATVNTRGLIIIENEHCGKVAVIPIGITEISSITIHDNIKVGSFVKKGTELGYFSYGGSSMALVFQKGMIKSFQAKEPKEDFPIPSCKGEGNCHANEGCLLMGAKIAEANLLKVA
ncbi:MAG: phophatidylserine decarboxylase associated domain-containing protein [Sulfuricellaceae bacterium]